MSSHPKYSGCEATHGPGKDAEEEQYDAHDGRAAHVALTPNLHVKPHQNGDRNRAEDGVGRPERIVHRVHDSNRKTCQREQQNGQHSPRSNATRSGVNFLRSDVGQRLPRWRTEQKSTTMRARRRPARSRSRSKADQVDSRTALPAPDRAADRQPQWRQSDARRATHLLVGT